MIGEKPYLELLKDIIENGERREDRTGTGTLSVFGRQLRFDISKSVPIVTTKSFAWRTCIKELLWFMRGSTDATELSAEGVKIWDGNTTRNALDRRGLTHYEVGDIGPGYGFQWRHFGASYKGCKSKDHGEGGVDQLQNVIDQLKNDPQSRRIFMSAWNPCKLDEMALPPCHISCQFYVTNSRELCCHMYQRSADGFLGLPFNIFSYTALTYILAKMTGLKPKELIISIGDAHIYLDHVDQVNEQLSRPPYDSPTLTVSDRVSTITNVEEVNVVDDFCLSGYKFHPPIKATMSV